MTVPVDLLEYGRASSVAAVTSSIATEEEESSTRHVPILSPQRRRLLELLPALDIIFKPVLAHKKKSKREIEFYERKLQLVPELRPFVPSYYGIRHIVDTSDGDVSRT